MSDWWSNRLTSNWHKFRTILHNTDSHLNFYEVIKTEIRSLSFECQSKIQRVFAFEPVPSLKAVPRALSHFTIIILGVKLSNGWNREVLHIVKIWCLLCKSYCPFEYERGSEEAVLEGAFLSDHKAPSKGILARYPKNEIKTGKKLDIPWIELAP